MWNKIKIILVSIIFFQFPKVCFSQINLEQQYNIYKKTFYVSDIGNNNYKYIISDSIGFSLYNLDHTPYLLNVVSPITLWSPPTFYQISYVSNSLFDCDSSNIEYVVTQWNHPANFYIYRTDNTLLFQKDSVTGYFSVAYADGSQYLQPIENTPSGTKLFLSDNKSGVIADNLYVYSLCGTLPASINKVLEDNNSILVYPNPTNGLINFKLRKSAQNEKYKLTIFNSFFQKIDEVLINGNDYSIDIKQKSYSAGLYLFDLKSADRIIQTGKFVITK
jgi:hypothetical protein